MRWTLTAIVVLVAAWFVQQAWCSYCARQAAQRIQAEHVRREATAAPSTATAEFAEAQEVTAREQLVEDAEGKLLWGSPTSGESITAAYVPNGTQCLVYLRLAELSAHPEGEKVLAALGPWGSDVVARLEAVVGAKRTEIEAVLASIVVGRDEAIDACLRVELVQPWDDAELASRHSGARARKGDGRSYLTLGDRAWFLAPAEGDDAGRTLVVCPAELAAALIESEGTPPMLARDMESLVAQTDADRTATVIMGANFLAAGGVHLVEGQAGPLRDAVARLLGKEATAAALSVDWGDSFFVELRATPALTVSPRWLATTLKQRVAEGRAALTEAVESQSWSEYGGQVVARVPAMVDKLASFTRSGEDQKQAVLRAYLPAAAGHNLLMGAELLLTQAALQHAHADVGMAHAPTLDEKLATVTSLSFPKETLQRALELLAEDMGAAIEIDGAALRAEGITQNQTLTLDLWDRPAGEILVEILLAANPDRTAEGPADPRQKLVYVVEPAEGGGGRIVVTTRSAAAKTHPALPAVFGGPDE